MKILITGICGFVGSTLSRALLESEPGLFIYGIDNFIRSGSELNRSSLQGLGIRIFHGDIRIASDFEGLPAVDWVIDAAANPSVLASVDGRTSSRQLVEHNLLGTLNILEYCKRHGAGLILFSTSRVYSVASLAAVPVEAEKGAFRLMPCQGLPPGLSVKGISEEFSTAAPVSLYGSTKFASEVLALEYGATFDFPVWVNRCGVLAGAGQFGRVDQGIFTFWINSWLRDRPLRYSSFGGHGHQVRDCLHPRDLVPLLRKQKESPTKTDRIINLGGGIDNSMSLAELSVWCSERFGPRAVAADLCERRFDIPWLVMDSSLARQLWDWQPQTTLESILNEIACHAEKHPNWLELSGDYDPS